MPRVYATAAEYETFTGQLAPANAGRLLARASRLVDRRMAAAIYDTDPAGFPSDTDVRDAFRDAVSAQVEVWARRDAAAEDGEDPAAGPWTSISAGGISLSRQSAPVATADDTELTTEAVEILDALALDEVVWS
ncbi:hypothetical protein [Streptomyces wuyuanensis]|uniref:Uncharacterized protein n=1 Tax=Streptomyces wuyuanensis TaxID=1196353 RepID=A0A1G9VYH6_9ACTN|nr:hypothetical protein [Streptomyces wuyuanensis]SDM77352.1 hypothetical protein SAMN05444921_11354 [Streptomyces wuyuanensis]